MKLDLRSSALSALVTLLAGCGTEVATRDRTENGGDDTASTDTSVDGSGDTSVDGSGDTGTSDTTLDTAGSGDTGTSDTTSDTGGSGDTGTVEPVWGDGTVDDGESVPDPDCDRECVSHGDAV